MKKTLSLITAIVMIVSLVASFGAVNASAATNTVSLYSAYMTYSSHGGNGLAVYVKTTGNASDEAVSIHYRSMGEWNDVDAEYFTTLDDGSKIWKANFGGFTLKYAIKYVANGVEYWDNNNGNDYSTTDVLGDAPIAVNTCYCYYTSRYGDSTVGVTLKNFAYNKNVVVRYTTNNWASYTDVPMAYNSANNDGTENWTASFRTETTYVNAFEYCVYYQVNGQTYWANNFGENYNATYYVYR